MHSIFANGNTHNTSNKDTDSSNEDYINDIPASPTHLRSAGLKIAEVALVCVVDHVGRLQMSVHHHFTLCLKVAELAGLEWQV